MVREAASIDISDSPELLRLAEEVQATGQPRVLRRGSADIAMLVPAGSRRRHSAGRILIDTSSLPQIPDRSIEEIAGAAGSLPIPLSWDEMRAIAREDAFAAKYGRQL